MHLIITDGTITGDERVEVVVAELARLGVRVALCVIDAESTVELERLRRAEECHGSS